MAEPKIKPPATKLLDKKAKEAKGVKLSDASVIVSFGRGVRKKEDMAIVEKFAEAVGGAIGCSVRLLKISDGCLKNNTSAYRARRLIRNYISLAESRVKYSI